MHQTHQFNETDPVSSNLNAFGWFSLVKLGLSFVLSLGSNRVWFDIFFNPFKHQPNIYLSLFYYPYYNFIV